MKSELTPSPRSFTRPTDWSIDMVELLDIVRPGVSLVDRA